LRGVIFGCGEEHSAKPGGLALRIDGEQADISEPAGLVGERYASPDRLAIAKHEEVLRGLGEHLLELGEIGALAVEQIGLMGPAEARRVAAIGRFDQRVQRGKVGWASEIELHRPLLPEPAPTEKPARIAPDGLS